MNANQTTVKTANAKASKTSHVLGFSKEFCSCGSDTCLCQICGEVVCGTKAKWFTPVPSRDFDGNVCERCESQIFQPVVSKATGFGSLGFQVQVASLRDPRFAGATWLFNTEAEAREFAALGNVRSTEDGAKRINSLKKGVSL